MTLNWKKIASVLAFSNETRRVPNRFESLYLKKRRKKMWEWEREREWWRIFAQLLAFILDFHVQVQEDVSLLYQSEDARQRQIYYFDWEPLYIYLVFFEVRWKKKHNIRERVKTKQIYCLHDVPIYIHTKFICARIREFKRQKKKKKKERKYNIYVCARFP